MAGRVAVVTGGAGGIGSAICAKLASDGATVVIGYNKSEKAAAELAATLPGPGRKHMAMALPVVDSMRLKEAAAEINRLFGRCDVVVNGAGVTRFVAHADLDALDDDLIDQILDTNVRGTFATVRAFRPYLKATERSVVVNISSIAGVTANGSNIMYCASKAAVDNMTKSLARALAPEIRVVSVSPGLVDTEFVQSLDVTWRNEQAARSPLKRLAYPAEVADAVAAAISTLTFGTGYILPVDGGRPLS